MWRIIARLHRKPGLSQEQFRTYYETKHVPLAVAYLKGLATSYSRSYVAEAVRYAPEEPGWQERGPAKGSCDCITVIDFSDRAALYRALALLSESDVVEVIVADEERFIAREMTEMEICEVDSVDSAAADLRTRGLNTPID